MEWKQRIFRDMTKEKLKFSKIGTDKDTLEIKFVDNGFGDLQTMRMNLHGKRFPKVNC